MGQIGQLRDVTHGRAPSRLRLLAPLRYLQIRSSEKTTYDVVLPLILAAVCWVAYWAINPKPELFGDSGLLRFTRDLLIMGVPFMVGALAAVAMGSPGVHMERRPRGVDLYLDGRSLTLRQFTCYLLGYLSFLGMLTLGSVVAADLLKHSIQVWLANAPGIELSLKIVGTAVLSLLLSALSVTVFWSLYFLTDVINHAD